MENRVLFYSREYNDAKRFASYFHQLDLALELEPQSVLEIGKGNGILTRFFKEKLGYSNAISVDIDAELEPDYVRDVRELDLQENSFDLVLAYEILEHVPFKDFEKALSKMAFVAKKNVVISLPINKGFFGLKSGMITACHEWEINKEHPLELVRERIKNRFKILKELNPKTNSYHYFFVLKPKKKWQPAKYHIYSSWKPGTMRTVKQ